MYIYIYKIIVSSNIGKTSYIVIITWCKSINYIYIIYTHQWHSELLFYHSYIKASVPHAFQNRPWLPPAFQLQELQASPSKLSRNGNSCTRCPTSYQPWRLWLLCCHIHTCQENESSVCQELWLLKSVNWKVDYNMNESWVGILKQDQRRRSNKIPTWIASPNKTAKEKSYSVVCVYLETVGSAFPGIFVWTSICTDHQSESSNWEC